MSSSCIKGVSQTSAQVQGSWSRNSERLSTVVFFLSQFLYLSPVCILCCCLVRAGILFCVCAFQSLVTFPIFVSVQAAAILAISFGGGDPGYWLPSTFIFQDYKSFFLSALFFHLSSRRANIFLLNKKSNNYIDLLFLGLFLSTSILIGHIHTFFNLTVGLSNRCATLGIS